MGEAAPPVELMPLGTIVLFPQKSDQHYAINAYLHLLPEMPGAIGEEVYYLTPCDAAGNAVAGDPTVFVTCFTEGWVTLGLMKIIG